MSFEIMLDEIASNLKIILEKNQITDVKFQVSAAKPGFGDASCNAPFLLAGRMKKSPHEIAKDLAKSYTAEFTNSLVTNVTAHPSGYLNFDADWDNLGSVIIKNSTKPGYGTGDAQGIVTVEHTSVNPNKALHIGHLRNIIIGDTISRILEKYGYDVRILNYIDDSGLQVAELLYGFMNLKMNLEPSDGKKFDHYCGDDVYVRVNQEMKKDAKIKLECAQILKMMEDSTSKEALMADTITKKVLDAQLQTCWKFHVRYDCLNFESHIIRSGMWDDAFEKLKQMNLVELESEGDNAGCWIVRGDEKEADKVLVRTNGTATYMAKDIPYAAWKLGLIKDPFGYTKYPIKQPDSKILWQTTMNDTDESKDFASSRVITVIDSRQARLQKIITKLMGKFKSDDAAYVHLGYESVTLSKETAISLGAQTDGKEAQMSGRRGVYVNADTVLESLKERTRKESAKRNPQMSEIDLYKVSENIAIATIRYEMIRQDLDKIITFDEAKSLSLEGDTASYIQYTYARASSILERYGKTPDPSAKHTVKWSKSEKNLLQILGLYSTAIRDAAANLSPKTIARYCHDLAVSFNAFYENIRVLDSDNASEINSRVCLVFSLVKVMDDALSLLGIIAPKRM